MAQIITISNRKGGAAKTTTALGLAGGLRLQGQRVLLVDMDGQRNLTFALKAEGDLSVYDVLQGGTPAADAVVHAEQCDVIPADENLELLDTPPDLGLAGVAGASGRLRTALQPIKGEYDFIIIDTPPAIGLATINGLTAANGVIIPIQADVYSLKALEQMNKIIDSIRKQGNKGLKILGLLLTRFSGRANLDRVVLDAFEKAAADLGTRLYDTHIREGVAIREAAARRKSMFAGRSKAAGDYAAFVQEFLQHMEEA